MACVTLQLGGVDRARGRAHHDERADERCSGPLLGGADYVDVKTADSSVSLREFVAAMLAYEPWWVRWLFKVRGQLVRLIGLRQPSLPPAPRWTAADVPTESFSPLGRSWHGSLWSPGPAGRPSRRILLAFGVDQQLRRLFRCPKRGSDESGISDIVSGRVVRREG